MNDRIKELYIQTANETADGKEWAIGGLLNAKRFTDLIIKECITQIALIGISNFENDEHGDIGWTVDKSIEMIKDHFGITE